ncbi:MAG: serine/threonine protein kinase [Myxococcales bacterium]|nr:serine/threonine protein kinase [Myxococcales bacterium]
MLDIDVRCKSCGVALGSTGARRLIGKVVLGQYELVEILGQGGMSVVYKGRHKITEQPVALKILPPELAAHSQVKSRFLEEARALAQLDHPNIVHLYNFGEENGSFVLAMQFVGGKTWERLIFENQRLSWQITTRIAVDVLRALEYAHSRGIVHRDMKSSNVLIRATDGSATVMDFGIAKMTTSSRLTATGQTMGTVRYMSPEQVRGQEVDISTDLYSLGATMYESLTGETPFDGSTHFDIMTKHLTDTPRRPSDRAGELPPELEDAVLRCLAKVPGDRFNSARELRKLLERVLREQDAGLVETQKVSRDLLLDVVTRRPDEPSAGAATGALGASPSSRSVRLASEELPVVRHATALAPERHGRRRWRWLALVAMAVAGAGVATVVLLRSRGPRAKAPPWEPRLGELAQQAAFPELGLDSVRTPASVSPRAVADAYQDAREAFGAYLKEKHLPPAPAAVRSIVVVPRQVLCMPSAYQGVTVPQSCETVVETFRAVDKILVVVDDPAKLEDAMRLGVAEASCAMADDARLCEAASLFHAL